VRYRAIKKNLAQMRTVRPGKWVPGAAAFDQHRGVPPPVSEVKPKWADNSGSSTAGTTAI